MKVQSPRWEDPLQKEIATHPSILSWKIPSTEGPGGLQSMGFPRQQCWIGLLFPSAGDLPNPGIKPVSPPFPALPADSLSLSHLGSQPTLHPFKNVPVLPLRMYYYQLGEL